MGWGLGVGGEEEEEGEGGRVVVVRTRCDGDVFSMPLHARNRITGDRTPGNQTPGVPAT